MVMDTRKRDQSKTNYLGTDYWQINGVSGKRVLYGTYNNVSTKLTEGRYKEVVSERDGKFLPGKFRANPCIMRDIIVSRVNGYAKSLPSAGYLYEMTGDWWYLDMRNVDFTKYWWLSFPTETWDQNQANVAWVKAQAKIQEAEFDCTVALGELAETLAMLKNPFKALTDACSKLYWNVGRARKGLITADALTGAWMSWRYGIKPLISDILKIVELWDKKVKQLEGMQRKAAGIRVIDRVDTSWTKTWAHFTIHNRWEERVERKTTYHVYYERLLEANLMFILRSLGMHPSNIPAGMWELTSKSFVWDWFFLVGDWLRAITPDPSLKMLGACVTQKTERLIDVTSTHVSCSIGLDPTIPVVLPAWRWRSEVMERRVGTAAVALPPFNPNFFKLTRMLDSLSMMWGSLTRDINRIKKNAH